MVHFPERRTGSDREDGGAVVVSTHPDPSARGVAGPAAPAAERPEQGAGDGAPSGPLDGPRGAVQRLLQDRMRERGWSYGDVARRSGLPRSTVHHLATTPIQRAPRPSRLEALAGALELPLTALQAAVAEATGLSHGTVEVEPDTAVIVAGLADLSPDDRRHVAALVESLRAASARRVTPPTER